MNHGADNEHAIDSVSSCSRDGSLTVAGATTVRFGEHHGLLGTVIGLKLLAGDEATATQMEATAVAEIERLQVVFDLFDPSSRIRRWQRDETDAGPEITAVLAIAEWYRGASGGAFDPYVGALRGVWDLAAHSDRTPVVAELAAGRGDTAPKSADLNAIAKGWIVDRAVMAAWEVPGAVGITINAGGDIRHDAPEPIQVGIEDPHRPFDNVPPLQVVQLERGALASSGGARRGWIIAGQWYSHVLDPRTGHPVDHVAQATVQAPTAIEADAIATALTVLAPAEREPFLARVDAPIGFLIVNSDGSRESNAIWDATRVS